MKAKLDDVFKAFSRFHYSMMPSNMPPISKPQEWEEQAARNREALKFDLDVLGISDCIDWTVDDQSSNS